MAKTEVILTHNVPGLGGESDHVKVAAGYARNYLFPQGLAIPLTAANKRRLEVLKQRRVDREAHDFTTMTELSQSLSKLTLRIAVKTGEDGKLFGAVTAVTILDELKHQLDVTLDKRKIHLSHPIKNIGDHEVELRLHPQITTSLKVKVESTTPPPPVAAPPAESRGGERHGRGRGRDGRDTREGRDVKEAREGKEAKAEKPEAKEGKKDRGERKPKGETA